MSVRNDHLGLFVGRYAFHLHTVATDGRLTVAEYVRFARAERLDRLVFLEHIRREPTYDVEGFVETVRREAEAAGVHATIGFEAKLLPGGTLDIDERDLERADVIGIAEHGFPDDEALLWDSLDAAFERYADYAGPKNVVWVHPGLYLRRRGRLDAALPAYRARIEQAWALGLAVERNLRYRLVPEGVLPEHEALVVGLDAHRTEDLRRGFPERPVP